MRLSPAPSFRRIVPRNPQWYHCFAMNPNVRSQSMSDQRKLVLASLLIKGTKDATANASTKGSK